MRSVFNLFKKQAPRPDEPSLEGIELDLRELPGAVAVVDHFPRVHWPTVHEAAGRNRDHPAIDRLWTELAAQWLGVLRGHLGQPYELYESDHLLLLSPQGPGISTRLAKLGDAAYARLERLLRRSAQERGHGKHAVLVLATEAAYYDYICHFYPGREQAYGRSAGVHLSHGYRHTAINGQLKAFERTLVHELAHDMVPGNRPPLIDARQVRLHRRYWARFGMNHFWDGSSFSGVASQRLSYQLSEVLFRNLANHRSRGRHLNEFLADARREDAGAAAALRCFGRPHSALVEEFLGTGPWEPKDPAAPRQKEPEGERGRL